MWALKPEKFLLETAVGVYLYKHHNLKTERH